ncbi:Glycosyltransferase involved in cell wall bisynthesis [Sanguibacter gelidistatuariae]|uniref:Glycosyltransferase involved in cell wall bisynthesis n=1 Tax=Sanguibacter gelidistatuariae TaxID=1814289 RepID=A0A1G6QP86_9MICO|nr:glycosyltransferase family 4 protein [Sanguibacter gelidistatuariae]SDC94061.1 Glycosyltransferase involved in cell wall bisynthesis [Sanguibacter gelidistatuariae]
MSTQDQPAASPAPIVLPTVDGRPLRVGVLVYNDCHADARVLKTAATLHDAGADVRIVAVARARAGFPEGLETLDSGVELLRVPEFELVRSAPRLAALAKKVLRVGSGAPAGALIVDVPAPSRARWTSAPVPSAVAVSVPQEGVARSQSMKSRAKKTFDSLWMKTYQVVSLAIYHRGARKALAEWRPDVVHANDANTLAPASRAGVPVVYDSHELWTHRNVSGARPVAKVVEKISERRHARRAAGVITVSPSIATWLQDTYRLPVLPTLVRNIPGRPSAPLDPSQGRLRSLAGLRPEDQVIAYGGRITTSRGIEETLRAMVELPADVHFVLLGYGEPTYIEPLKVMAADLGVTDRVHFVGRVGPTEVAAALADADLSVVYVRPTCLSYRYSLPNKLFEAIHAGLPVAAADLPDTAQIVRDYGVGEVFSSDSPHDLARVVSDVLAAPEQFRAAARAAAQQLTWEGEAAQLLGLYRRVLDASGMT